MKGTFAEAQPSKMQNIEMMMSRGVTAASLRQLLLQSQAERNDRGLDTGLNGHFLEGPRWGIRLRTSRAHISYRKSRMLRSK